MFSNERVIQNRQIFKFRRTFRRKPLFSPNFLKISFIQVCTYRAYASAVANLALDNA
jgi:hypothetical protein